MFWLVYSGLVRSGVPSFVVFEIKPSTVYQSCVCVCTPSHSYVPVGDEYFDAPCIQTTPPNSISVLFCLVLSCRFRLTYLPRLPTSSNLSSQSVCALLMCVSFDRRCPHPIYPVLSLKSGFMTRSSRNLNALCTLNTITGYLTVTTLIICLGTLQPFEVLFSP